MISSLMLVHSYAAVRTLSEAKGKSKQLLAAKQNMKYFGVKAAFFWVSVCAMHYLQFKNGLMGFSKQTTNFWKDVAISVILSPEAGFAKITKAIFRSNYSLPIQVMGAFSAFYINNESMVFEKLGGISSSLGGHIARKYAGLPNVKGGK